MKMPNFFIIGAPKCGTTSLATWLAEHPYVYMSPLKEPHYFNFDMKYRQVPSRRAYEHLFEKAGSQHTAVGEASVFYLFSKTAVPHIETEISDAKYIVMLRNPVDMCYSFHDQNVYSGEEPIRDFEQAWRLSPKRREGRMVPRWCRDPQILDYQSICKLGEQLERLLEIVPQERVLVLILDDIKQSPRREYLRVLNFLNVPDDGRTAFTVHNTAKERRWPWLRYVVLLVNKTVNVTKKVLDIPGGTGLKGKFLRFTVKHHVRPPMSPELRGELLGYFKEDVLLLSRLIDRDLSMWLQSSAPLRKAGNNGELTRL